MLQNKKEIIRLLFTIIFLIKNKNYTKRKR